MGREVSTVLVMVFLSSGTGCELVANNRQDTNAATASATGAGGATSSSGSGGVTSSSGSGGATSSSSTGTGGAGGAMSSSTGAGGGASSNAGTGGAGGGTSNGGAGGAGGAMSSSTGAGGGTSGSAGAGGGSVACAPSIPANVCQGNPVLYPDPACAKGDCVVEPLSAKVLATWKDQAIAASGVDEPTFWSRVQISSVERFDGPQWVSVTIHYVLVLDWMRPQNQEFIVAADAPLVGLPSDAAIAQAVTEYAFSGPSAATHWQAIGMLQSAPPPSAIADAFASCGCGMQVAWCNMGWQLTGDTAAWTAYGKADVDVAANSCLWARVNVATAQLLECKLDFCVQPH